jgi:hypothetical protein
MDATIVVVYIPITKKQLPTEPIAFLFLEILTP